MEHEHERRCAQCGKPIPAERDRRALYCDKQCKRAFHNMSQVRGQEIMALLEAQAKHRYAKPGSDEHELQRFARQQASALIADYLRQNAQIGRDPARVVRARMDDGVWVMDKRRPEKRVIPELPWIAKLKQKEA